MLHWVNILEFAVGLFLKIIASLIVILFIDYDIFFRVNIIGTLGSIFLLIFALLAWTIPLAYLFDRYRILRGFLPQILLAVYLITPILWPESRLSNNQWIYEINPVFHLVNLVRAPLLNGDLTLHSSLISIGFIIFGLLASLLLFNRNKLLIAFRWIA
jgi:lipopolysaccharide transport system permease protein